MLENLRLDSLVAKKIDARNRKYWFDADCR